MNHVNHPTMNAILYETSSNFDECCLVSSHGMEDLSKNDVGIHLQELLLKSVFLVR